MQELYSSLHKNPTNFVCHGLVLDYKYKILHRYYINIMLAAAQLKKGTAQSFRLANSVCIFINLSKIFQNSSSAML